VAQPPRSGPRVVISKNFGAGFLHRPRIFTTGHDCRRVCSDRALCAVLAACCVRGVRFCLHSAFNQRYESVGAKFVAEKLISLAPSHNGFRSPFERFAARGAHTVCGGWMRLTVHAFVLPPKEDKHFRQNKMKAGLCDSQDQKMSNAPINASSRMSERSARFVVYRLVNSEGYQRWYHP
jgi:hypothetical protein